jgi:acetyl-CoA C-acetyltransferase
LLYQNNKLKEVVIMSVVIVSACRTAIGKFDGSLKSFSASDLGAVVIKEAIRRAGLSPDKVDEAVMGCVGTVAEDAFLARVAAIKSGMPVETTAQTVNRLCASGLQAIVTAAMEIDTGFAEICVAGGTESMTNLPYYLRKARQGYRMGHGELEDGLVTALTDPFSKGHMGLTAENVAEKYNISRKDQDEYALFSQQRAEKAIKTGLFKNEIVPVEIVGKKETIVFDTDEHPRFGSTIEGFMKLKPAFREGGTVTAGNAAGVNDGAAAVILMSEEKAEELSLRPLVRIKGAVAAGVDPALMGIGPVTAIRKLLHKTGVKQDEIGLIELNEAFAAQTVACIRELGLDLNKVNVNGSGISLGHPIGATGCIITVKLINDMLRKKEQYGIASLCIGGGQGLAVLYELV